MEYKDAFVNLRGRYGEKAELYFRPHMNLFNDLIEKGIMTREEVAEYRKNLKASGIIQQNRLADMEKSIADIDIFLTDISSVMVCFFLTCRPIIYCEFANAEPFPEYAEMFGAMYIARSWEDVEKYLDELIAGNDPLLERRQAIAAQIYETHKDASEKILDKLIEDYNQNL
jgi:CDP-glycerol glycerophosphotransferase (TagB/SpsB family)